MKHFTGDCRRAGGLASQEMQFSRTHATALAAQNPPLDLAQTLPAWTSGLLREPSRRHDAGQEERHPAGLTPAGLGQAADHAEVLRLVKPGHGVQVIPGEYLLTLITGRESRTGNPGHRATRVARGRPAALATPEGAGQ